MNKKRSIRQFVGGLIIKKGLQWLGSGHQHSIVFGTRGVKKDRTCGVKRKGRQFGNLFRVDNQKG